MNESTDLLAGIVPALLPVQFGSSDLYDMIKFALTIRGKNCLKIFCEVYSMCPRQLLDLAVFMLTFPMEADELAAGAPVC